MIEGLHETLKNNVGSSEFARIKTTDSSYQNQSIKNISVLAEDKKEN